MEFCKYRPAAGPEMKGIQSMRQRNHLDLPAYPGEIRNYRQQEVEPGRVELIVKMNMASELKIIEDAPNSINLASSSDSVRIEGDNRKTFSGTDLPITVNIDVAEGDSVLNAESLVYCCRGELCFIKRIMLKVPVSARKGNGIDRIWLELPITY